jgi:hypothetical protein
VLDGSLPEGQRPNDRSSVKHFRERNEIHASRSILRPAQLEFLPNCRRRGALQKPAHGGHLCAKPLGNIPELPPFSMPEIPGQFPTPGLIQAQAFNVVTKHRFNVSLQYIARLFTFRPRSSYPAATYVSASRSRLCLTDRHGPYSRPSIRQSLANPATRSEHLLSAETSNCPAAAIPNIFRPK